MYLREGLAGMADGGSNGLPDIEADGAADLLYCYSELVFNRFYGDVQHFGHFPVL